MPKEDSFLLFLAFGVFLGENRGEFGIGDKAAVEHHGRGGHRGGHKILHLIHPDALERRVGAQREHIAPMAAGVGGDEIGDQFDVRPAGGVDAVKLLAQALEIRE